MRPAIRFDPIEVSARLYDLELIEKVLRQAIQRGMVSRNSCTDNHPRPAPGYHMWSETVAALRELLIPPPANWHREDAHNLPLVVNDSGTIALIVATGDDATGRSDADPCTNSAKGPNTRNAVTINHLQQQLFPYERISPEDLEAINGAMGRMTWLLLMHYDAQAEEVRCELSRPINMSDDGHVGGWVERIILSSIPFSGPNTTRVVPEVPQSPVIDVKVKKRA